MSAPSIPNLLSLRGSLGGGSRGGGRGHGRGRGRGGGPHSSSSAAGHDTVIQGTDTDAAVSRMSAVDAGYLEDPFAQFFVQRPAVGHMTRRLPIINRGTYARTAALDRLISSFLSRTSGGSSEQQGERQIISLGAGTDTRVFRLLSPHQKQQQQQPQPQPAQANLIYHEIDFPAVTAKKLQLVRAVPPLRSIVPDPALVSAEGDETTWSSSGQLPDGCEYWCHGRDLRDLLKPDAKALRGLRPDVPTLLVSECCLCYLEPHQALEVIRHFADKIPNLAVVLYEPIKPDDPFGRQMVSNLAARRIRMPTLDVYKDAKGQQARLRDAGFEQVETMSVEDIWRSWIPEGEKERVDGLEGLDEVEEWNLLAAHYIVAWAWRGQGFEGWNSGAS